MEKKIYEVDGMKLGIKEVSETYGISLATLHRRLRKGLTMQECVHYVSETALLEAVNRNKKLITYPDNLILDLITGKTKYKFDMAKIKENFIENYNAMIGENMEWFEPRDLEIISMLYEENRSLDEVSGIMELSRQWICEVKKKFIDTIRTPYFSDYFVR